MAVPERRRSRPLLGTFVEIKASSGTLGPEALDAAIDAAFAAVQAVHAQMSFQDAESELSRLNAAGGRAVAVSPATLRALRLGRAMTIASDGRFNCTLGGALVRAGALPDHGWGEVLPVGAAEDILLGVGRARLARPVLVTLDGLAKGLAVDLAVCALRRRGVASGVVNAGGDLRVFGDAAEPVHRRAADGTHEPLGLLSNAAVASSAAGHGDAERFPGLLLDPAGEPPPPGVWSVLARQAWRADALTKVAGAAPKASRAALIGALRGQLVGEAA